MYSKERGQARYKNLYLCNDVWACPTCAARIAAGRRDELQTGLAAAFQKGWTPVLVTLTLRHHQGDRLATLLDALLASVRGFKSGRGFKDLRYEYDWRGDVRGLEVTYGANGWHPHCHLLVFLGRELTSSQLSGFRRWIAERWQHQLELRGQSASLEHGVDVRAADADIADYVAKFGRAPENTWTSADEIARSISKRGHRDGLTPWQLLDLYGRDQDDDLLQQNAAIVKSGDHAGRLYVEYAETFATRSQLQWSRGLRDALDMGRELDDDEVIDDIPGDEEEIAMIDGEAWKLICRLELRGELLDVAAAYGRAGLRAWLKALGISHIDLVTLTGPPPGKR